ncbi:LOW QUALITY PROTEIN: transportin-3-like [Diadema antillarum]|uniref:transportin-3-like n=1 Tax=Diadema antillarum TaxID=105358 RepID=UPI003A8B9E13
MISGKEVMESASAPPVETVSHAIHALYHNPDAAEKERASLWLQEFQRSLYSWEISDQLLQMKQDVETCYFAAQTMRTKIQYAFHELPVESHNMLRDSLINHLQTMSDPKFHVITTQLCLALADLALQMTQWKNSAAFLIHRFYSSNATHIPLLIELLTILPEEVDSHSLRLGLNRREEFRTELGETAATVIELLTACSENYLNDQRLLGKIFKCLASWFYSRVCPSEEVSQSKIIALMFELLKKPDTPSMLHEAAGDCLCAALYSMEDVEEHLALAKVLYQGIILLPEAYAMAVAEEDVDKCINYCRVFTELAEAFMEMMVETPNQGFGDLRTLDAVLTCVGHPQSEVAEITFNFWYRLSEIIYKRNNRDLTEVYRPYIERLIHSLSVHCQIDTEHEGVPDESDDFGDFRIRVSELIKDVIFIVGSSTCFAQMFHNLASQQGASWEVTEAALFIMSSVAKNVLPDESRVVPQVMQAIINLPEDTHKAVRYTSTRMLGELAEWIEKHAEYLDPILTFLMAGLRDADLASVSAQAIQNICSECREHLQGHLECLLNIAQAVDAFNLSGEAAIGIIKGTALVLAKMPLDKVQEGLKRLVLVQVTPLSEIVKGGAGLKQGASTDPTVWLDRLAAIFRHTNPQVTNGQVHPCLVVLQEIWPVLSETCSKYQGDIRVIERYCRCLRFAIRCIGKGAAALLTPLVTQIVGFYQSHTHSCYLYLGSILVDEYGAEPGCISGLIDMLQAFIGPTYTILQEPNGLRNHPDTVDDFFRLCTRLLQRCPLAILQSAAVQSILQCAIAAVTLDHREANSSVMKFFSELVRSGVEKWEAEDFERRKALVVGILQEYGEALLKAIMEACAFYLPAYRMPDHGEVIFHLIQFDRESMSKWLEGALQSLPAETAGRITATPKQLSEFHESLTSAEDEKNVCYALRDFTRLYR